MMLGTKRVRVMTGGMSALVLRIAETHGLTILSVLWYPCGYKEMMASLSWNTNWSSVSAPNSFRH